MKEVSSCKGVNPISLACPFFVIFICFFVVILGTKTFFSSGCTFIFLKFVFFRPQMGIILIVYSSSIGWEPQNTHIEHTSTAACMCLGVGTGEGE